MQEFDLAEKVLEDVVENDTYFNEALRKIFQANVNLRPMRGMVAGIVGCELRHHILFEYLLQDLTDYTPAEKRTLSLALANLYFYKHIKKEDIIAILQEKLSEEKFNAASELIAKADQEGPFIPESIAKHSNKYLSLRFNTPEWVLKIFEHYGYGSTYKILKKNNRPFSSTVRVRTSAIPAEEVIAKFPDFKESHVEGILTYAGKESLRKNPLMKDGTLFKEKPVTKEIVDKYHIEEPNESFVWNGNADSSLLKEVIENYGASIGINLGVPNLDQYADVSRLIKQKQLKNVNFFGSSLDSLLVSISRPQDLVICAPASSNFDLIREQPDYLLHFNKGGMDELFAQEKEALLETSKFVAEGGTFIYMIYTISKKEGHQTIFDFMANHPEFQFVEERQYFPYEEGETALYYAVLHKDSNVAKTSAPLSEILGNEQQGVYAQTSAAPAK
jgi:16S rRNA C967 or C1407 C5-methylase (RsmB/RsmF family)